MNAMATRARAKPRLKKRAPERASPMIAASTMGGGGNFEGPTRNVANHQLARNTRIDSRRSTSVSEDRVVVGAGLKFLRRPNQFATADISQHAIKNARVGFLVGDRATRDTFPITIAVDAERGSIGGSRKRRDLALPIMAMKRRTISRLRASLPPAAAARRSGVSAQRGLR